MDGIALTLDQTLEPYGQRIKERGVEFIWEIGEALTEAKQAAIEFTGDKRAPGFSVWCKDSFNFSDRTAQRFMKSFKEHESDLGAIWGNANSPTLTSPTLKEITDKYQIIYADPPWQYGNTATRANAESHYPTMSIEELCKLDIEGMSADNAILFMWVTPPLLPEIWPIFSAWGFEYKTVAFFWGKQNNSGTKYLGIGNYTRSNVEMCTIAKRGKGLERVEKSISNLHMANRLKHSEKPHKFRELIEQMYGKVNRIELFARTKSPGWNVWGNEVKQEILI